MNELTVLLELIRQHTEDDTRRFASVDRKLDEIAADVRSLVESRDLARGARRTVATVSAGVAASVSAIITWLVAWLAQ